MRSSLSALYVFVLLWDGVVAFTASPKAIPQSRVPSFRNQRRRYFAGIASTRRRPTRITCAASDPSSELVLDPSRRSDDDSTSRDIEGISNDDDARLSQRALLLRATGDSEKQQEEEKEQEETGWVGETLSKGAEAVVSGVKSAARASKPLRREADGRIVPDGDGLLNLCILLFSGLWIVHSIVTVDATMWRGWTLQETLIRLPWDNWDSYEMGLLEHPIITKTAINVGIYLIGDWLSQVKWGREEDVALWEFDLQRTLRNGLIGACFGPVVHFYYNFSDWVLPPSVPINRPFKIMLDQSIYFCSKCAVYILLVSLLRGDSFEEARGTVKEKLKGVVTTGWRFWPFVHIFTYFLIPPRHRVLWVNCVDLLWSSILAGMTSGAPAPDEDAGEGGGEGEELLTAAPVSSTTEQQQQQQQQEQARV
ncbi:unnamed protein product [Ectocarpus sp. 8 AP-2014]